MKLKELKDQYKKLGGYSLIKNWYKAGIMRYIIPQFILLGTSKKSLETIRLIAQQKIYKKLRKRYLPELIAFDNEFKKQQILKQEKSNIIWICWLQGIEHAPKLVKECYNSIRRNLTDRDIILLTFDNINNYITFPSFIQKKYQKGIISNTHLSDIIRVELLSKYGGTWIDATVFCTSNSIPSYMLDSDFFVFQNLKPGTDGHILNFSNWFITSSKPGNKFILAMRKLLYKYWEENNVLIDYFIFHYLFTIICEFYQKEWEKIVPFSNSTPHILLLRLFKEYDEVCYNEIIRQTPFHKLAYKRSNEEFSKKGTYYDVIFNQ